MSNETRNQNTDFVELSDDELHQVSGGVFQVIELSDAVISPFRKNPTRFNSLTSMEGAEYVGV